ncbi:hypothetical protein [Yinghuangia sp. YIM S09857]|uniref:hypothetical protein n=1 Tax=Yinghuangia sp. YIM S09857 TaxID=3436929 RepID=UPI003F539F12
MEPRDPERHGTDAGDTDDTRGFADGSPSANPPGGTTEHEEREADEAREEREERDAREERPTERDSEETKVLGIDQSAATAPPATSSPATSHVPENDPDWRPGMLPRDWEGRTTPWPAPAASSATQGTSSTREFGSVGSAPLFASPATPSAGSASTGPKSFGPTARSRHGDTARRHGFDPMAMVAGTIFMAIAVMYMLDAGDAVDARPGLMLALAVIGVGASGFVGAVWAMLTGRRNRRTANTGAATATSPATPPSATAGGAAGSPVDFTKGG